LLLFFAHSNRYICKLMIMKNLVRIANYYHYDLVFQNREKK
jgi:hypothetical protein